MRRILTALTIIAMALNVSAQVSSRISTRTGVVNQLKTFGRVTYQGINYYPAGKDSLLLQRDIINKSDSVILIQELKIDGKPHVVSGFKPSAFERDLDLKYIRIPENFTTVSNSCFYECHRLAECEMPSIKQILGYAFFRTGFNHLVLHEGLEYIGNNAYQECSQLEYLELPSTLKRIDDNAFLGCERLDTVKVNFSQPIELGSDVFWLYRPNAERKKKTLLVPAGSKAAFEAHKEWQLFQTILEY